MTLAEQTAIHPNFFIVGCPKSGTTSMFRYLKKHPELFMPEAKEPHFFGRDIRGKVPYSAENLEEYLSLFKGSEGAKRRGEASIYYIYSEHAADEIHAFNPNAKIILLLREPVEMIYSLHFQHIFNQWCFTEDFAEDLKIQEEKHGKEGEHIHYRSLIKNLPKRLERFYELFGRQNVLVLSADDFRRNTPEVFKQVLEFLEVDSAWQPKQFTLHNQSKVARTKVAGKVMGQGSSIVAALRNIVWKFPKLYQLLIKVRNFLFFTLNSKTAPRPKLEPALRNQLRDEFRPALKDLERLWGRDLSDWYEPRC